MVPVAHIGLFSWQFSRYCETKFFRRKNVIPLLISIFFFHTRKILKHSPVRLRNISYFSTVRLKAFAGKSWYPPPHHLSITFFHARNFLKHRKLPRRVFLPLWHKKLDKNVIPLLSKKIDIRTFLKHKGYPTTFFGNMRRKSFSGKSWYPRFLHKLFRYSKFFEKFKFSPPNFLALWDKETSTE